MNRFFSMAAVFLAMTANSGVYSPQPSTITSHAGFALIELFTSEGCSSCPDADKALIDIAKEYKEDVYILGFHVDYWDRLGWKDISSDASYSKRQQEYGRILSLNSIYTPQVVINGQAEFVGSDRSKLHNAIEKGLRESSSATLQIQAKSATGNQVTVDYTIHSGKDQLINIALVEKYRKTEVKGGENRGRTLEHINLVRDFRTVKNPLSNGSISLKIPSGLQANDVQVIAFLQDKSTWHVLAAGKVAVN
jgi:hypothetical protein